MPMSVRSEVAFSFTCALILTKMGVFSWQETGAPVKGMKVTPSNEYETMSAEAIFTSCAVQLIVGSARS